jgi:hypothetical protein
MKFTSLILNLYIKHQVCFLYNNLVFKLINLFQNQVILILHTYFIKNK